MRNGTWILLVGLVIFVTGAAQPAVDVTTSYECRGGFYGECGEVTHTEPNTVRPLLMGLGGFLFTGGFGATMGARDAEARILRAIEERNEIEGSDGESANDE